MVMPGAARFDCLVHMAPQPNFSKAKLPPTGRKMRVEMTEKVSEKTIYFGKKPWGILPSPLLPSPQAGMAVKHDWNPSLKISGFVPFSSPQVS